MQPVAVLGASCSALALVGYGIGLATPYPGRAFTLTGLMVGITLFIVGVAREGES
jgi:hypothetical protein